MPIPTAEASSDEAVLQWRVHLARQRPGALAVVACILAAATALAYAVFGHPLPVALTLVALFASVSEFLLPITYRLMPDGVSRMTPFGTTFLPWNAIRSPLAAGHAEAPVSPFPGGQESEHAEAPVSPFPGAGEWGQGAGKGAGGLGLPILRLSTLARPSPLDAFRGLTLRLPEEEDLRARVLDALRVYLPQADPVRGGQ